MRDTEVLRRRLSLALATAGLLGTSCGGEQSTTRVTGKTDAHASPEGEAAEGEAGQREGERPSAALPVDEGEGESAEGEAAPAATEGDDPGGAAMNEITGESGEDDASDESGEVGESGEGESEFAYYAIPTDPYANASDGEAQDCPQGDWCGPSAKAMLFEAQGADREMGCPYKIASNASSQAKIDMDAAVWKGFSFDKRMQGRLSSQHTLDTRKARGEDDLCCYHWYNYCAGRPLMGAEAAVVAQTHDRLDDTWVVDAVDDGVEVSALPDELRERLAAAWLDDALMEHASVASFARTTLELMAVGAPAQLLADVQRAALDEVAHARACFGLHARYAGSEDARSPGPLLAPSPRAPTLARLAQDTFVEGCVGETIASLHAARAARRCADPTVRPVLERIADDEARHAALAWRTLAWCLREAGPELASDLRSRAVATLSQLRSSAGAAGEPDPDRELLGRHGRLTPQEAAAATLDAWEGIILPTLEACA